jgi:hypothetical protein
MACITDVATFHGVLHGFSAILIASQIWLSDFFVV